jgi:hypothetical protein
MSRKLTQQELLAAAQRLEYLRRVEDFDARRPGSRMTEEQRAAMDAICSYKVKNIFVTGGNRSGKSQMLRRLVSWFLAEPEEAQWKRRPEWQGSLTGILVSKSHKQLEGSLVEAIRPFFEGDKDFKIIKNGHYIERLEHRRTGNIIWVLVHENARQCRERVQSFQAHMCFLDEMPSGPSAFSLMEEIGARVTDNKGVFASFFTPKSINPQIKNHVESMLPPAGSKFTLSFLNNPGIDQEAKDARLAEIRAMPVHMRETLLKGSWMNAEQAVFVLPDAALEDEVRHYSPSWRHILGVDPGLASAQGVICLGEDPRTGIWHVIHAEKMEGITDVDDAVQRVWNLIASRGWNVERISYDPAGTYWYMQAKKHPNLKSYKIVCPFNKNSTERKMEMIANLQMALGTRLLIPTAHEDLLDEFSTCEWSETTEGKIKKGQKYHLLDALRYGIDCLPRWTGPIVTPEIDPDKSFLQRLRAGHEEYLKRQERAAKRQSNWRSGGRIVGTSRVILRR